MIVKSFLILSIVTLVHSWYPSQCCSGKDCFPVPCEEILEQEDGSFLYDGGRYTKSMQKPSEDSKCHICRNPSTKAPLCIFTLQGS